MATSSFIAYLGSNPITWAAKKQPIVSRSSSEAEYRALASNAAELPCLRILLQELHIYLLKPPLLWCDNLSALALASNPVFHSHKTYRGGLPFCARASCSKGYSSAIYLYKGSTW